MPEFDTIVSILTPGMLVAWAGIGIMLIGLFMLISRKPRAQPLFALGQAIMVGGMLLNSLDRHEAAKRSLIRTLEVLSPTETTTTPQSLGMALYQAERLSALEPVFWALMFGLMFGLFLFTVSRPGCAWAQRGSPQLQEA